MPQNRQYAGPHDAAELMVDDGRYALVVRQDITDEDAAALGYTFDVDEAVRSGRSVAVRTITVSDELAAKLDRGSYVDDAGELQPSWPKIGGSPADQTVDVPESNPCTRQVELDDGTKLSSAEADDRAYQAAGVEEVIERAAAEASSAPVDNQVDAARERIGQIDARVEEIDSTVDAASDESNDDVQLTDAEFDTLANERSTLLDERAEIEKALEAVE